VGVIDFEGVLPGVNNVANDVIDAHAVFCLSENERAGASHFDGIAFHHVEVGADGGPEIGFVDDQKIALGDAGAAFARDFIAAGDVDHLDGEVGEFATVAGGQVVAAGFDEQDLRIEFFVKFFEGD
jgi:hypothetical protein